MGIIDILKGIEKLAVELLLWFIYIPKTIYKIIKDPTWVPGYVHEELAKEDKFKNYLSPVLLFLGISVVLFVLLDSGIIIRPSYDQKSSSLSTQIQDAVGLLFLTIPLFFALFTEIFRKGGIQKEALLQNLYVQCYYLSPLMLSLFAYLIADQFDWESNGAYINVSETPLYLFSLTLLWYIIVQVKYLSKELRYKRLIALGIVLIWLIVIGAGFATSESLFTPVIVDSGNIGETETLRMTLPKDDEYRIDLFYADDYDISLSNINSNVKKDSLGLKLIHNQYHVDTVKNQLRFWFNANKGDQVTIHFNHLTRDLDTQLFLFTKNPGEDLLWDEEGNPTDLWYMEFDENNNPIYLNLYDLPENGRYHLILDGLSNIDEEYSIGFYKNDPYGGAENDNYGKLSYNHKFQGLNFNDNLHFNYWKFLGKSGDEIEIELIPVEGQDIAFDLLGSDGKSVVPIDRTTVANLIHWLYVIFFGYIIIIGFKAFFMSSKNNTVINENEGSKLGRIISIVTLVFTAIFILLYFLGAFIMAG